MAAIATQLQTVRQRIREAARAAGRDPASVRLLAVSKTFAAPALREAQQAGQLEFGENYIQEAVDKIAVLGHGELVWHCIGPIQSNKTRLVAEQFDWVHTVDRLKIAQRLSDQRPAHLASLNICVQVNVDGGPNKAGVPPGEALALSQQIAQLPRLKLRGLMSIPEPAPDFASQYALHQRAQQLFEQLRAAGLAVDTLSLGMSQDLEAAIHAGSTLVRVGTAIFGAR